jgi:hypothetical protein
MIRLLGATLPFKIEVVQEDSRLFFENLWLPGVAMVKSSP